MRKLGPDEIKRLVLEQADVLFAYMDGRQQADLNLTQAQRTQLHNLLVNLDAGTATNNQVQAALAKVIRMELREP